MQIPPNTQTYEGELATFWFDEDGILHALAKHTPRTLAKQKSNYEFLEEITGGQKVCLLSDTSSSTPQDAETREYIVKEMGKHFLAMAIISDSPTGRMLANLFIAVKTPPIPIKLFASEAEAKKWLKKFQ